MQCLECFLVVSVALGPLMVLVAILFYYQSIDMNTFFTIVCVAFVCCCTACMLYRRRRHIQSQDLPEHSQSEDAESGGDAGETSVTTDAPPKYDTVVGKPPPYSHLYTSAEACYLPVYHTPQHTDGDTTLTSEEEETTRDTDPPPYSEVSKTIAPV
ncbi:uncharacterized protein [Cherax quadricarinatus]|uniref:uncharacterized protein isoform X3 n=1 Tax=Cherax quadricarinatus TaxID=27406 RepID=UPI00237947DC|nr:uncharacterized protein LOC128686048 isoform X3 [Cherax quadricarinatus]